MSNHELNATARDLMSVRAMIAELEAEAEALTDKIKAAMTERGEEAIQGTDGKPPGRTSAAHALTARHLRQNTRTCTASIASRPRPHVLFSAYENGPHIPASQSKKI